MSRTIFCSFNRSVALRLISNCPCRRKRRDHGRGGGAQSPGLLLAVRSARSWVASGARQSETRCPITGAIIAATLITPITTTTINTHHSTTSGARTSFAVQDMPGAAPRAWRKRTPARRFHINDERYPDHRHLDALVEPKINRWRATADGPAPVNVQWRIEICRKFPTKRSGWPGVARS